MRSCEGRRGPLYGELSISNPTGGNGPDVVVMKISDRSSRCRVIEVEITYAHLMAALMKLANRPCLFELGAPEMVGSTSETKTEQVTVPDLRYSEESKDHPLVVEALAPFLDGGWRACSDDLFNSHRQSKGMAAVTFFRQVYKATGEPVVSLQETLEEASWAVEDQSKIPLVTAMLRLIRKQLVDSEVTVPVAEYYQMEEAEEEVL